MVAGSAMGDRNRPLPWARPPPKRQPPERAAASRAHPAAARQAVAAAGAADSQKAGAPVSYTHLRAHETSAHL
eukprot:11921667-Alexandrium_andersonii.AAC.1